MRIFSCDSSMQRCKVRVRLTLVSRTLAERRVVTRLSGASAFEVLHLREQSLEPRPFVPCHPFSAGCALYQLPTTPSDGDSSDHSGTALREGRGDDEVVNAGLHLGQHGGELDCGGGPGSAGE